jgi:hypothetical protein
VQGFQFFAMLGRVFRHDLLNSALNDCDAVLLRNLPRWQQYCRYVVVMLQK